MAEASQSAPHTSYVPEEPKPSLASNILAIVGFIILIVVVIWGLVNLAGISRSWFSSLFPKSDSVIEVEAPESAISGTPFTLSWKYDEPSEGTYAFLYQCESGLAFQTPGVAGIVGIPCGAAFTTGGEEKHISLIPYVSRNAPLDVPLSIIFMGSATGTQAQGSTSVRISPLLATTPAPTSSPEPKPAPPPTPTPTPISSTRPEQATPAPKLPTDLSVRIISVSIDASGNGVATFDIANIGGTSSGTYYFGATLPTSAFAQGYGGTMQTGYIYTSPAQSPLAPQAHVVSTLRFSQARGGTFSVSITAPDANGSNNYASQTVNSPYAPSSAGGYGWAQPGFGGTMQYQMYPYTYQQPYMYQYQSGFAPSYGGQYYSQQYPYSTYYPYAY